MLVRVGDERHLLEELLDAGELVRRADQLVEVLQPTVGFDGVLGLQLAAVAGALESGLQQFRRADVGVGEAIVERVEEGHEGDDPALRRAGDPGFVGVAQRIDEAAPGRRRITVELVDARVADPALGHVEDALDADLVGGVDDCPQVGQRVADLPTVVVPRAPDHLVRHAAAHQRLLDDPALGVRAVEHGDLAPVDGVGVAQLVSGGGDEPRLIDLVLRPVADDPVAAPDVGPQVLRLAVEVVGDHRVGGVEDRLRAAVVLVEDDRRHAIDEGILEAARCCADRHRGTGTSTGRDRRPP